jgi:hypothetical protein
MPERVSPLPRGIGTTTPLLSTLLVCGLGATTWALWSLGLIPLSGHCDQVEVLVWVVYFMPERVSPLPRGIGTTTPLLSTLLQSTRPLKGLLQFDLRASHRLYHTGFHD